MRAPGGRITKNPQSRHGTLCIAMVMVTFTLEVTASGNCVRFFFFREYLVFDRRSKSTSLRPPDGWHDVPFLWYDIRRPQDVFSKCGLQTQNEEVSFEV